MTTHEELVAAFGADGVRLLDAEQLRELGTSEHDTRILAEVGLPVRADDAFTVHLGSEPGFGSIMEFQTDDGDLDMLVIGGTGKHEGMRYFLDIQHGEVGLILLGDDPQSGVVNSSLEVFVDLLHRIRLRQQAAVDDGEDAARKHTEQLRLALEESDPIGVRSPDSWWSVVLEELMHRTYTEEMRGFLQQRRVEVD